MKRVLLLPLALCGMLPFFSCSSSPKSAAPSRHASEKSSPIVCLADKPSEGVYYSLFVRSFADSNGDGIGDFAGIIKKLDYLNDGDDATTDDLGITGIWLLPIYPSQSYHGYDVDDYYNVNPDYGTMGGFEKLLAECKKRGISVILDMTCNHSSVYNQWFIDSRNPADSHRTWYRWISPDDSRYNMRQQIWGHNVWNYYIVAARFTHPIQHLIDKQDFWVKVDDGIEICDKTYQAQSWQKPRRIVIVRQKIEKRPQAGGKQLSLFPEDEIHRNYRYSAYFTNQTCSMVDVWRTYRMRGDAENRIKELKQDFGAESFNLKDFYATEAALIFSMTAYNLMSLFRLFVLQEKTQKTLSTLRYRTFAIGAYFERTGDTLKLKIALTKKRRK